MIGAIVAVAALVAGVVAVLVSTGGKTAVTTTTASSTTRATSPLTQDELHPALLTTSDLPSGWRAAGGNAALSDLNFSLHDPTICNVTLDDTALAAEVNDKFEGSDAGPFLFVTVGSFGPDGARHYLDQLESEATCSTFTVNNNDGTKSPADVRATSISVDADQALRYVVDIHTNSATVEIDGVYLRRGDVISGLFHIGLGSVDESDTVTYADRAASRLRDVAG